MTTIWLECSECSETFEVSNAIADAMRQWRAESGEPFLCVECATTAARHHMSVSPGGDRHLGAHASDDSDRVTAEQIEWGEAIAKMEGLHEEK